MENKTARVNLRVTPSYKKQLKEMAAKRGVTLSQYIWGLIDPQAAKSNL